MAADGEGNAWGSGSIRKKIQQWESLDETSPRAAMAKRPTLAKQQSLRRLEETAQETKNTLLESGQQSVRQPASEETRHESRKTNGIRLETEKDNNASSFAQSEVIVRRVNGNVANRERTVTHRVGRQDDVMKVEAAGIRVNLGGGETEVATPTPTPRQRKKAIEESGPELHAPELVALLLGRGGGGGGGGVETNVDEVDVVDATKSVAETEQSFEAEFTSDWHFVEASDYMVTAEIEASVEGEQEGGKPAGESLSNKDADHDEIDSDRMFTATVMYADQGQEGANEDEKVGEEDAYEDEEVGGEEDEEEEGETENVEEGDGENEDEIEYTTDMVGPCMRAMEDYDSESTASSSGVAGASSDRVDYRKVKGHATLTADWCDVKLAALLYLRGINAQRQFRLAASVHGAGTFGDLVFKYKTDADVWHTCFIQLKHKGNAAITKESLTAVDGSFSLAEDYKSYCEIRDRMSSASDEDVFAGSFADCTFVLHTNAALSERLASRFRHGVTGDFEQLLKSGLNDDRVFRLGADSDKDVYAAMGADTKDFLDALVIFSGQPSEIEVDHLIKMELRAACSKYLSNVHIIYRFFVEAVQQWWRDAPDYLTQRVNVLDKAENILNVYNLTAREKHAFKLHEVVFRDACTAGWRAEVRKMNPLLCIVTTGATSRFSVTKLMQALREESVEYNLTSLRALLAQAKEVIGEWTSGQKDMLVVVSESSCDEEDALCAELCRVLLNKPYKQLVILSPPCNSFVTHFQSMFAGPYEELFDPFDIMQLDKDTTDQLLEREVRLQGYPIFLKCVIGEDVQLISHILTSDNFDILIDCPVINIGKELHGRMHHYAKRTLERRDAVKLDMLTSDDFPDTIAVSNITVDDLLLLVPAGCQVGRASDPNAASCKYLVLDSFDPGADFASLCESRDDAVVHWLRHSGDALVWKRSHRDVAAVTPYVDASAGAGAATRHAPDHVLDLDDRVVLVVGDAGTGRSTLATHLALETKQNDPAVWVIRADLGKCVALWEGGDDEDLNAVDFLSALENECTDFLGVDLLSFCVERLGNVAVFLDGFDEVVPRCLDRVLVLLTRLVETRIRKIFITCEVAMQDTLERRLSTFAYRLCPEERVRKVIEENARESFV